MKKFFEEYGEPLAIYIFLIGVPVGICLLAFGIIWKILHGQP